MIICKGIQKNGMHHPCSFIHEGTWGDVELIDHEKYHKSQETTKSCFWLGFEVKRGFNKITNRDGKP